MRIKFAGATVAGFTTSIGWGLGEPSQLNLKLVEDNVSFDQFLLTDDDIGKPFYFDPNLEDGQFDVTRDTDEVLNAGGPAAPGPNQVDPVNPNQFFLPAALRGNLINNKKRFKFGGILQNIRRNLSPSEFPTYDLLLIDPRQLLEGTTVILNSYSQDVKVDNLINVYGYWEGQQFGKSGVNESGMLWTKIIRAIERMTSIPRDETATITNPITPAKLLDDPAGSFEEDFGDFGGINPQENEARLKRYITKFGAAINYQGIGYSLDLSLLPRPPRLYRIGGDSLSLLELISKVCDDNGCDFIIEMEGYIISVRPISRIKQPPFGTVQKIIDQAVKSGIFVSGTNGVEARNEYSSAFILGGQKKVAHYVTNFRHYWGKDEDSNPIFGREVKIVLRKIDQEKLNKQGKLPDPLGPLSPDSVLPKGVVRDNLVLVPREDIAFEEDAEAMTLNAVKLSRILGTSKYECDTIEMRLALNSFDSWALYVALQKPSVADKIGLTSAFTIAQSLFQILKKGDFLNDKKDNVVRQAQAFDESGDSIANSLAVYQFVRDTADAVLGRTFAVKLDFAKSFEDKEVNRRYYTHEPADGGYLPDDVLPLQLPETFKDFFRNPDGNYKPFCRYSTDSDTDLSNVSPDNSLFITENDYLFVEVQVQPDLIRRAPKDEQPEELYAVFEVNPIKQARSLYGGLDLISALIGSGDNKKLLDAMNANAFGTIGLSAEPPFLFPKEVLIPLKSNQERYGPWHARGAQGKVRYEVDETLTPWSCGGVDIMNQIANSRVQDAASQMKAAESADFTLAEFPRASLGDTLDDEGPNITSLNATYDTQSGWQTTYRFQTYTSTFGVTSKTQLEINKRTRLANQELRRDLRQKEVDRIALQKSIINPTPAIKDVKQFNRKSPYDVLIGYAFRDTNTSGDIFTRQSVAFCTQEESLSASQAHSDEKWQATTLASITSLVRPIAGKDIPADRGLSRTNSPIIRITQSSNQTFEVTYDPFKNAGKGLEFLSTRMSYDGIKDKDLEGDTYRAVALSGPPTITGWGFDLMGRHIPGSGTDGEPTDSPREDFETRPDLWKAGPMDLLWNPWTNGWTAHAIVAGTVVGPNLVRANQTLPDGKPALFAIAQYPFTTPSGTPIVIGYSSIDGKWYTLSAGCE